MKEYYTHIQLGVMQNCGGSLDNSLVVPQQVKHRIPVCYDFSLKCPSKARMLMA